MNQLLSPGVTIITTLPRRTGPGIMGLTYSHRCWVAPLKTSHATPPFPHYHSLVRWKPLGMWHQLALMLTENELRITLMEQFNA